MLRLESTYERDDMSFSSSNMYASSMHGMNTLWLNIELFSARSSHGMITQGRV